MADTLAEQGETRRSRGGRLVEADSFCPVEKHIGVDVSGWTNGCLLRRHWSSGFAEVDTSRAITRTLASKKLVGTRVLLVSMLCQSHPRNGHDSEHPLSSSECKLRGA